MPRSPARTAFGAFCCAAPLLIFFYEAGSGTIRGRSRFAGVYTHGETRTIGESEAKGGKVRSSIVHHDWLYPRYVTAELLWRQILGVFPGSTAVHLNDSIVNKPFDHASFVFQPENRLNDRQAAEKTGLYFQSSMETNNQSCNCASTVYCRP